MRDSQKEFCLYVCKKSQGDAVMKSHFDVCIALR